MFFCRKLTEIDKMFGKLSEVLQTAADVVSTSYQWRLLVKPKRIAEMIPLMLTSITARTTSDGAPGL